MINIKITGIFICIALIISMGCDTTLNNVIRPTTEEINIVSETNRVRTNPGGYASELKAELEANRATLSQTRIGEYEAAIATLESTTARNPLSLDDGLYRAARDHAEDLIKNDIFSHTGSNGSSVTDRIQRYGSYSGLRGENLAAGTNRNTGASMVLAWVLSPGHLGNMLNSNYTLIGIALLPGHPTYNWVGVQKFAAQRN